MWANSHLNIILVLCTICLLIASGSNNTQPKIYDDNGHLIIESAKDRNISFILSREGRFIANETDITSYSTPWQTSTEVDKNDKSLADEVNESKRALFHPFITSCESSPIEFTAPSGTLYSPGWPGKYIPKLNCSWILRAPMEQRIVLDVKSFSLESSAPNDYVEIRDGNSDSPPIGRFYGIKIPSRLISFTNSLYITFITDDNVNKEGFHFEWQTTTVGCGGTLNSYRGFIIPPHYPDIISPGTQCDWRIIVNPGSSITAVIESENFKELGGCDTKQIIVFNGNNPSANIIKPNCSEQALHYTSTKNHMLIRYETEANEESTFFVNYNAKCGGELRDIRGVVESPNFPNKYSADLDCRWNIINRKGNKIVLALSHLDLEGDYNKLHISDLKNGVVLNEYLLQSKEDLSQTITALGDALQIHFTNYRRVSGTGFRLEYELQGCSMHLTPWKGFNFFESPDYPYAIGVYCEWIIETTSGEQIELTISQTELEGSADDCLKNGLIVYSDEAHNNSLIKVCSTHPKEVVATSAGSRMFVTFFTDDVRAKKYFKAEYKIKLGRCGGVYNAPKGYLTSPNFPSKYSKGDYCEWLVGSGYYHTVDLSFEHFNIPNTTNCEDSFLEVYDGKEKKAKHLLLRHCGTILPSKTLIQSTKQNMLIVFSASRTTEPGLGFKIYYKRSCGRKIVIDRRGLLIKQFNDNNCLWTIASTNPTQHVTLMFSHVECKCGKSLSDNCEQNLGTQIYDGDSIEAPFKTSFCNKHPLTVYSNGPALTIRANSGYFKVFFDLIENACGGTLSSLQGEFATPKYPNSYPLNVECEWDILAEDGNTIELSFNKLQIYKTSEQCNEDYLEVRDAYDGKLLGLFCGNESPQTIRIYRSAWIKFRSDGDFVGNGFLATWSYAHESEINGTSGIIKSPPIANVNIDPENYKWRVIVPRGNLIKIYFEQYIDGLQLFDGFDETAIPVAFEYKTTITSSTNIIYITSENSILSPFWIKWQAISINTTEEIGGDTTFLKKIIVIPTNDVVNITSPGYPTGYANELDYEWILKPNDSSVHVVLMFFGAELERSPDCINDYIQIYSGENMFDWTLIKTYCNEVFQTKPVEMFHGAPYSKLVFHSDISRNGTGFLFKATTFCGAEMTEPEGIIRGITAPSYIYGPKICTWRIHVTPGKRIKFQFTKMNIPASTENNLCERYVSIRDGFDEGAALLGQGMFCKDSNLTIPETATNRAFVHSFALNFRDMDWELKYTTVSYVCGGPIRITKEHNSINITTPNYPNISNPYSDCVWTVLGPPGESLHLTFLDKFDLHESNDCATEFVEVRDGSTSVSRLIGKFCHKEPLIASTENAFYIKYFTNSSEPRNGFKAHIKLSKCGGTFRVYKFRNVISKNYPSPGGYPSNYICEYNISVWEQTGIIITFNDVHLPIRQNRNESDHLSIYVEDEESKNGTMKELTTIYGDNVPAFLQTFSSEVLVKFFTYQPNTAYRGWSLTFKPTTNLCNARIINEWGEIIIPRNIFQQQTTLCTWFITVPKGRRINLVVDEYDVDEKTPSDYVLTFYNDDNMQNKILSTTNIADIKIVNSTDSKIVVKLFKSSRRNFFAKLSFTSYELSYCPADITEDSGTIIAPDISETYFCSMEYQSSGGQTIMFKISELMIAYNSSISNDTFKQSNFHIYKGDSTNVFETSRNLTDFIILVPFQYRSMGRILMIQDEIKQIKKLVIHYKIHNCGGEYWTSRYNDIVITTPYFNVQNETMDCAWQVFALSDAKTILNATFSVNPACEKEYILIYSGNGPSAPQMAKICGNAALSHNLTSDIYIHYHKEAVFPSKFKILFTKDEQCGGPVYPTMSLPIIKIDKEDYKNNMECIWNLENRFGLTVTTYFSGRFFIEDSINCTKDYVEIRALLDNEWKTHARVCGRQHPKIFDMTLTKIMIVFRTDNATVGDGFTMYASQICGGVFNVTKQSKTIDSPNRFRTYSWCIYTLQTQTADRIKVHFNTLDKRKPRPENTLEVYKGKRHNEVEKYSLTEDVKDIYSKDSVKLVIKADQNYNLQFSFIYQLDSCGGIVTEETKIQSLSDENMNCLWNITGQSDTSVFIEFKYLNFNHSNCSEGYVEIFGGHELSDANKIAHVCGETRQQNVLYKISENKALVLAVSNIALNGNKGFSAQIRFRKKCDGNVILTQQNSTYIFDRFASGYEDNLNCIYVFYAPDGNYITMNFHLFNLTACPYSSSCTCDFLEIRDGDGVSSTLNNFCGDKLPPIVISSRNKLFVHFASDDADAGKGFNATVTFVPSPCGPSDITFNETKEIVVKSPDHNGYYPPNIVCHWTLHSQKPIELHFDQFDLEEPQESGQCLDFLEISYYPFSFFNYSIERTRQILCGKQSYSYFMTRKSAELTFRSNSEVQRHGFSAKFRLADECNTTYTALSGMISKQPDNDECVIYFNIPATYTLAFVVENDLFESNCSKIIEFYDENTKQQVQTTCASPQTAFINSNNVKVKFFKNVLRPLFPLTMTYIATNSGLGCGGNISAFHGKIASPLYPEFDGIYSCQWNINVPQNFIITISFLEFNIGSMGTCSHIYLKVLEGTGEMKEVRRFCGDKSPNTYTSTNNKLSLIYNKTIDFQGTGWVASYHAQESSFSKNIEIPNFG